jgi:hypothetical protein
MTEEGGDEPTTAARRDPDEPLGDLVNRVRARREEPTARDDSDDDHGPGGLGRGDGASSHDTPSGGEGEGGEELFEEMNVGNVDADAVWESVLADEDDVRPTDPTGATTTPGSTPDTDVETAGEDGTEAVVEKQQYCQSCDFFTAPPEVACTHEGSEIAEIVDGRRFRVRNCPVVSGEIQTDGVGRAAEKGGEVAVGTGDVATGGAAIDDSE